MDQTSQSHHFPMRTGTTNATQKKMCLAFILPFVFVFNLILFFYLDGIISLMHIVFLWQAHQNNKQSKH